MKPDDHRLLEQTRKANKTLSLFAFALQEEKQLSADSQLEVAELLAGLAESVRVRVAQQATGSSTGQVLLEGDVERRWRQPEQPADPRFVLEEASDDEQA